MRLNIKENSFYPNEDVFFRHGMIHIKLVTIDLTLSNKPYNSQGYMFYLLVDHIKYIFSERLPETL